MVPVMGLVSMLISMSVRIGMRISVRDSDEGSGWRDFGRAADVLRQSSEAGRRW